jgi:hypothetical protein
VADPDRAVVRRERVYPGEAVEVERQPFDQNGPGKLTGMRRARGVTDYPGTGGVLSKAW